MIEPERNFGKSRSPKQKRKTFPTTDHTRINWQFFFLHNDLWSFTGAFVGYNVARYYGQLRDDSVRRAHIREI